MTKRNVAFLLRLSCRLQAFDPPIARRFALRQLELMSQGLSKIQARDKVEVSLAKWLPRA